ncbi:WD40-repeat-containing domain protein [Haematococcus lacustris]
MPSRCSETDPDKLALLYVQQWLQEQGYVEALAVLEKQSGLMYDDSKLTKGSQLMQLVYQQMEQEAGGEGEGAEAAAQRAEEEQMLRGGAQDFVQCVVHDIASAHPSSVTAVRLLPNCQQLVTGSGDGVVRRLSWQGELVWASGVGQGGVLCLDLHPSCTGSGVAVDVATGQDVAAPSPDLGHEEGSAAATQPTGEAAPSCPLLAAGSMDGSVSLLDLTTGTCLTAARVHLKYLVRVVWCGAELLATCSHDQHVGLHAVSVAGQGGGSLTVTLTTLRKVSYAAAVQDIALLRGSGTLAVAVRGSHLLRLLQLHDPVAPEGLVNLNASGDSHVSFSARHLLPSPCSRFLLVSTDTGRMLVLRCGPAAADFRHTPYVMHSLPTEQFHQFAAAWHRDAFYVYAGALGGQVWVYHVGSGKVVARLPVHKINVRDLHYDPRRNLLATASFDKTVKVLGARVS